MTAFESNLLAGAIILVVDLFVTYEIIVKVIEARDKRVWEPARRRLLSGLKRVCENGFIAWARNTDPPAIESVHSGVLVSPESMTGLADKLRAELVALGDSNNPEESYPKRPPLYWRAQVHGLATIEPGLSRAIDRVQITLRGDSDLVAPLSDLEDWSYGLPGLDKHLAYLESQGLGADPPIAENYYRQQLILGCVIVVNILKRLLSIWDQLVDVPGLAA